MTRFDARRIPSQPRAARALGLVCATLVCIAMSVPALAQDAESSGGDASKKNSESAPWYIEYMAGVSHAPNQTLRSTDAAPTLMGSTESEVIGYFVGGAVGRRFADYFRAELQVGYRSTEVENAAVRGEPEQAKNARLSLFTAMVNGYFDLDFDNDDFPITPWVGLGLGWGMPRLDAESATDPNQLQIDDTDSVFVYNAMVGASLRLTEIAEATLGYRYVRTQDFELGGTSAGAARRFDYEYDAHEGYVGIRFNF